MKVENAVHPEPDQATQFFGGEEGPFVMINLLKFKNKAEYPDGSGADLSGAEAYRRYGTGVAKLVEGLGGRIVYGGRVTGLMIGAVEELWDAVALAEYPSLAAMQSMVRSPEYQALAVHRTAGLAGQLNIQTRKGAR